MATSLLDDLQRLIARHARPEGEGVPLKALPNITVMSAQAPTVPLPHVAEPMFSVVLQGRKEIELDKKVFNYGEGQFLIVSVELPITAHISEATKKVPFLGLGFALKAETIASLLLEAKIPQTIENNLKSVTVSKVTNDLVDPLIRLLRLLDRPSDIQILAPAIEREILWRLLTGPQGAMIKQIGLADSRMAQISRAIRWIRNQFNESIRIEELAEISGMSVTSFHRHFRAVTSMTPIQYQKQIRLQKARSMLMSKVEYVTSIGLAVGYDSPSQFSREYRRLFGVSPGRDGERLRRL